MKKEEIVKMYDTLGYIARQEMKWKDTNMKFIKINKATITMLEMKAEIARLESIINDAIEYLNINKEIYETCETYDVNGIEVYKILQGLKR